ncbi:MAG: hypothetical protein AB1489_25440 [Acidobacteriota bacterium]
MAKINLKMALFLIVVALVLPGVVCAQKRVPERQSSTLSEVEVREYISENGYGIRISALGNLVGLKGSNGYEYINRERTREGYLLAYRVAEKGELVLYDIFDKYSSVLKPDQRDLVAVSFDGPETGSRFSIGTIVNVTVVVTTADGRINLTHSFTWLAGTGRVTIKTEIRAGKTTDIPVELIAFKRFVDINITSQSTTTTGGTGTTTTIEQWNHNAPDLEGSDSLVAQYCNCLPKPPGPPVPIELVNIKGINTDRMLITAASDLSETTRARLGESLPKSLWLGDNQGILGWLTRVRLEPEVSTSFTTNIELAPATYTSR